MPLLKIQKPYIILFMGYAKLHTQQQILEQHGFQYQVISKLFKTLVQGSEVFQNLVQFKSVLGKYIYSNPMVRVHFFQIRIYSLTIYQGGVILF